jgi:hypothetical protein
MAQQGQVFPLAGQGKDGTRWAYRYRVGGRGSKRVQRGGFASEQASGGWWSHRRWPSSSRCTWPSTRVSRRRRRPARLVLESDRAANYRSMPSLRSSTIAALPQRIVSGESGSMHSIPVCFRSGFPSQRPP